MNESLFILEIILTFGAVVLTARLFGKDGLTAWVAIALILANILTTKAVTMFGIDTTLGTIMFASTFLATDILTERYGGTVARKAVVIGICAACVFVVCTQVALLYVATPYDIAGSAMAQLFALSTRTTVASIVMCLIANLADVWLFERIKRATGGKYLWLRNNVATIVCNCTENFLFVFLAFYGIFPTAEVVMIAVSTSIFEAVLAVFDTPFCYLALKGGADNDRNRTPLRERPGTASPACD